MPTAGRLAGAIAYAVFGWYIGIKLGLFFPEQNPPDFLIQLCIGIGIVCGWKVVGARANKGYYPAIGHGLTGAFAFSFWVLFIVAFNQMIQNALRRRYDGPVESIIDIFAIMVDLGQGFLNVSLIASIAIGGVIGAWVAEYYAKRYP